MKRKELTRRVFISMLLLRPRRQPTPIQVAIIETFDLNGKTAAMLVHHANPFVRESFAAWLRSRTGTTVRIQTETGTEITGSIFRTRLCFGRGLIIPDQNIHIHEREMLSIVG